MKQSTQQENHADRMLISILDAMTAAIHKCALMVADDYAAFLSIPSIWIKQMLANMLCPFTEGWQDAMPLAYAVLKHVVIKPENDGLTPLLGGFATIDPQMAASYEKTSGSLAAYHGLMRSYYDLYAVAAGFPEIIGQPDEKLMGMNMLLSDLERDPEYSGGYRDEGYTTVKDYKDYIRAMVPKEQWDTVFSTSDRTEHGQHN
jgi:hypothetical protein